MMFMFVKMKRFIIPLLLIISIGVCYKMHGFITTFEFMDHFRTTYVTNERDWIKSTNDIQELEEYYYNNLDIDRRNNRFINVERCFHKLYKAYKEDSIKGNEYEFVKTWYKLNPLDFNAKEPFLTELEKNNNKDSIQYYYEIVINKYYDQNDLWRSYFNFLENDSIKLNKVKVEYWKHLCINDFSLKLIGEDRKPVRTNYFKYIDDSISVYFKFNNRPYKDISFKTEKFTNTTQRSTPKAFINNKEYKLILEKNNEFTFHYDSELDSSTYIIEIKYNILEF